jgi:hypothetical protein
VEVTDTKVPASAGWLGGLGAAPFIGLAGVMPFLSGSTRPLVAHAIAAYGATILSFLGGVHWGLAIGSQSGAYQEKLPARLGLSVLPSLAGWAALLVGSSAGLYLLTVSIATMCWVDIRASRTGHAPRWYPRLRIPLTCAVVTTLLTAAMWTDQ